jgi:nicotinamidase/pyrazinamidase
MRALILVDIQYDFLPGGALAVPAGDDVIRVANAIQERFDLVVATQDWHPEDHGSFARNHPGRRPGELIELDGLPQVLWPAHCVQGTRGADLPSLLETRRVEAILRKGMDRRIDSYSGFFDNGQRRTTGLGDYLRGRGATSLFILGLATDYCVKHTALDARRLGFTTTLIEDGCRGVELQAGDVAAALALVREAGVQIARSSEV